MSRTNSTMLPLGTKAPDFELPDVVEKRAFSKDQLKGSDGLLVMFISRHCPYIQRVKGQLAKLGQDYKDGGIGIVAISSNDVESHPVDSPLRLKQMVEQEGFTFHILYDESQEIAKAYKAACTPDFFLFDKNEELVYRGQLDGARPGNTAPCDGKDLREAMDAVLDGKPVSSEQAASMGCNIKWKPGNAPDYFG